jgi:hypothetical protein
MAVRATRTAALALAASAFALSPAAARAHDCVVACASQPGHVEVQLQSSYGAISRDEGAGSFAGLALFASAAVAEGVTLSALLPSYAVDFGGRRRSGLGDVSLGVSRASVRGNASFYVASVAHLPTGDAAEGLGAGHAMVMLGTGGTWAPPGRLRLGLDLLDALAPTVSEHHVHTPQLVAPHSMHELFYEGWGAVRLGNASVRAGVAGQTTLASGGGLRTAVTPTFSIGLPVASGWAASWAVHAPQAGRGYFGWQTTLAVTRALGSAGCDGVVP